MAASGDLALAGPGVELTDAALILRCRGGDETAFTRLLARHRDIVDATAAKYFAPGGDRDDLRQEALIGFNEAVRDYSPLPGGFRTFAKLCVERKVITALKRATRHKHVPLNQAIGIDVPIGPDVDSPTLADLLPDRKADVVELLDSRSRLATLTRAVNGLTELERTAIVGIAVESTYEELAAVSGASVKSIDNAAQRARVKLARQLELVADSEPLSSGDVRTMVVEQQEVEPIQVTNVLRELVKERKLDSRADGYRIPTTTRGPVTKAEKDAVECIGSGRTAKEVARNCQGSIRDVSWATAILEGLCRRSILKRRPGSNPAVYEKAEA